MKQKDIFKNAIEILKHAIKKDIAVNQASVEMGFGNTYFKNTKKRILQDPARYGVTLTELADFKNILKTYNPQRGRPANNESLKEFKVPPTSLTNSGKSELQVPVRYDHQGRPINGDVVFDDFVKAAAEDVKDYNAFDDERFDERSTGEYVTNDFGVIEKYRYHIAVKDENDLIGELSRDEMNLLCSLYSNIDGGNLTQKAVSNYFPHLTYRDLKRILRAFKITKQMAPVAPHILLEKNPDEIMQLVLKQKENTFLKHMELKKQEEYADLYKKTLKELTAAKDLQKWIGDTVEKYYKQDNRYTDVLKDKPKEIQVVSSKPLISFFGDIHFGKRYMNARYGRGYNQEIARERLLEIAQQLAAEVVHRKTNRLVLVCLGDSTESILEAGMHPGHGNEMDLMFEDQIFASADMFKEMVNYIKNFVPYRLEIEFFFIGGNHDRIGKDRDDDRRRTASKIVGRIVKREMETDNVRIHIPENNLVRHVEGRICIFNHHGDSSLSKKDVNTLADLFGEPGCINVIAQGHWHQYLAEEHNKTINIKCPAVCSTDAFTLEQLASNNLPGYVILQEHWRAFGVDILKKALF